MCIIFFFYILQDADFFYLCSVPNKADNLFEKIHCTLTSYTPPRTLPPPPRRTPSHSQNVFNCGQGITTAT